MKMGYGSWAVVVALIAILILAGVAAFREWNLDQSIEIPAYGYVAIILGLLFSLLVGVGLMALMFFSSRYGYDEPHGYYEPPKNLNDSEGQQ
jgi:hypothetical protein